MTNLTDAAFGRDSGRHYDALRTFARTERGGLEARDHQGVPSNRAIERGSRPARRPCPAGAG